MVDSAVWDIGYLIAAALFILGIKRLSSPRTAPQGNRLGAMGMFLAVLVTLTRMYSEGVIGWELIVGGLALGTIIGALMATKVEMTGMPELVALFNGFRNRWMGHSVRFACCDDETKGRFLCPI